MLLMIFFVLTISFDFKGSAPVLSKDKFQNEENNLLI